MEPRRKPIVAPLPKSDRARPLEALARRSALPTAAALLALGVIACRRQEPITSDVVADPPVVVADPVSSSTVSDPALPGSAVDLTPPTLEPTPVETKPHPTTKPLPRVTGAKPGVLAPPHSSAPPMPGGLGLARPPSSPRPTKTAGKPMIVHADTT
jgi:hypothetical protein